MRERERSSKLGYLISFTYNLKYEVIFFFIIIIFNLESSYKDKRQWDRKKGQSNHRLKKKKKKKKNWNVNMEFF